MNADAKAQEPFVPLQRRLVRAAYPKISVTLSRTNQSEGRRIRWRQTLEQPYRLTGDATPLSRGTASRLASRPVNSPRFAFLALGEAHQLYHILGPALELARSNYAVTILVTTVWHRRIIEQHSDDTTVEVRTLRSLPRSREPAISDGPSRLLTLLLNMDAFRHYDIVVTPERTSTLLKRLGLFSGMLAHIPHGAGDRAAGYDKRIKYFDCVIVAGEKDRRRMIERKLAKEPSCIAAGYAKFDVLNAPAPFFDNAKPIVLYNPHFAPTLSSWPSFGAQLIEAFSADKRFNYIIAPHIRMRGAMRKSFEKLAARNTFDHLRFDGGSVHSINMDYTRAASIYLGDVSSQVYEFIREPRQCVFLNPARINWRNDEHFAHWHLGEVAETIEAAMIALGDAETTHSRYTTLQNSQFNETISASVLTASERIAHNLLHQYTLLPHLQPKHQQP